MVNEYRKAEQLFEQVLRSLGVREPVAHPPFNIVQQPFVVGSRTGQTDAMDYLLALGEFLAAERLSHSRSAAKYFSERFSLQSRTGPCTHAREPENSQIFAEPLASSIRTMLESTGSSFGQGEL